MRNSDYKTWVELDSKKLRHNIQTLRRLARPGKFLAMVKCNAYGHGLTEISTKIKDGVDWLGVDTADEAVQLRKRGIRKPILVVSYTPPNQLPLLLRYNISQVVADPKTLAAMRAHRSKLSFRIHLKIDTGMSRQGILYDNLEPVFAALRHVGNAIELEGVMTHFATSDEKLSRHFEQQQKNFSAVVEQFKQRGFSPKYIHANNTAALLRGKGVSGLTLHRSGIGLYGLLPSPQFRGRFKALKMKPVLSWKTRIIQIKTVPKGAAVGYGATERVRRPTRLAVLPVGYYEGLPRLYSSVGHVLINGRRCRLVGRISMNFCVADITHLKNQPRVWHDEVVIIGRQDKREITADEFARAVRTINYEVVTRINPFIPRIVL